MPKNNKNKNKRTYDTFNYPNALPGSKTLLTGIRENAANSDEVYITGFYEPRGDTMEVVSFVYKGNIHDEENDGSWYELNYPSGPDMTVKATNLYGPDSFSVYNKKIHNGCNCSTSNSKNERKKTGFRVVGNYTAVDAGTKTFGCLYEGPLNGSGQWITLLPTSDETVINTIAHSTMHGLVVGNYDTILFSGKAFIYDIEKKVYYDIIKEGSQSITAYGIWYNGSGSYTICGGYTSLDQGVTKNQGYLVDWKKHKLSNWRSYDYGNDPVRSLVTHFDGITSDGNDGYNLTGDRLEIGSSDEVAFFANVKRKCNDKFSRATWSSLSYPGSSITSGNSVYEKIVIGVYAVQDVDGINGYISDSHH